MPDRSRLKSPINVLESGVDDFIDKTTEGVNNFIRKTPVADRYERWRMTTPTMPEREVNTPFGKVVAPEISLPALKAIELQPKRREALKAGIAIDASSIIGIIPVVGDIIADGVEDTFGAKLRDSLTTEEMDLYTKFDKAGPSALAIIRTYGRTGMRRT